jgi:hypothetical protein
MEKNLFNYSILNPALTKELHPVPPLHTRSLKRQQWEFSLVCSYLNASQWFELEGGGWCVANVDCKQRAWSSSHILYNSSVLGFPRFTYNSSSSCCSILFGVPQSWEVYYGLRVLSGASNVWPAYAHGTLAPLAMGAYVLLLRLLQRLPCTSFAHLVSVPLLWGVK